MNWQALKLSLKHASLLQVLARYAYRGIKRCIYLDILCVMCLPTDSIIEFVAMPEQYEYGFVDAEVLRREAADAGSGLVIADVEAALSRQEECFGAWTSQQLVSYLWFAPQGERLFQDVHVHFPDAYCYSRWAFTRAEYRGQHLYPTVKHLALNKMSQRGKSGFLSLVDVSNLPSLHAAQRAGCRRVGLLLFSRIGKQRVVWASPGSRRYNVWLEVVKQS